MALYRIAQEALNNVAKHAEGALAALTLRWSDDAVDLAIEDGGAGFDAAAVAAGRLGLVGMRERAAAIGASLEVDSSPGRGTRVAVSWRQAAGVPTDALT